MYHMDRHFVVDVSGLPAQFQSTAEKDIRVLATLVTAEAEKLELPFLLNEIKFTKQFSEEVNSLTRNEGHSPEYTACRDNVLAYGMTIQANTKQDVSGFIVLIDANIIDRWNLGDPWCLVAVLHEFGHVVFRSRSLKKLGKDNTTEFEFSKEREFDKLAILLMEEYDVDRFLDMLVGMYCKKDNGEPFSLRELEHVKEVKWIEALVLGLENMPQKIDSAVLKYEEKGISLQSLDRMVVSYVVDLLVLLSHISAMYMKCDTWPDIISRLTKTEAARRFFGNYIETIPDALRNPEYAFDTSVRILAQASEEIIRRCGLTFENAPKGMRIRVSRPFQ